MNQFGPHLQDGFQENFMFRGHKLQVKGFLHVSKPVITKRTQNNTSGKDQYLSWDAKQILLWEKNNNLSEHSEGALGVVASVKFPKSQPHFIGCVVNIPKMKVFLAAALDMSFKIYDKNLRSLESIRHDERAILHMEYDSERDLVVTGGASGINIWRLYRSVHQHMSHIIEKLHEFEGAQWVSKLIYQPEADRLYALRDRSAQVMSFSRHSTISVLEDVHEAPLTVICWYDRSQFYITGCSAGEVKCWTSNYTSSSKGAAARSDKSFALLHVFKGHARAVTSLKLHPVSGLAITAGLDGLIKVLNLQAMTELFSLRMTEGVTDLKVASLGDNQFGCLFSLTDASIRLYKITSCCGFFGVSSARVAKLMAVEMMQADAVNAFIADGMASVSEPSTASFRIGGNGVQLGSSVATSMIKDGPSVVSAHTSAPASSATTATASASTSVSFQPNAVAMRTTNLKDCNPSDVDDAVADPPVNAAAAGTVHLSATTETTTTPSKLANAVGESTAAGESAETNDAGAEINEGRDLQGASATAATAAAAVAEAPAVAAVILNEVSSAAMDRAGEGLTTDLHVPDVDSGHAGDGAQLQPNSFQETLSDAGSAVPGSAGTTEEDVPASSKTPAVRPSAAADDAVKAAAEATAEALQRAVALRNAEARSKASKVRELENKARIEDTRDLVVAFSHQDLVVFNSSSAVQARMEPEHVIKDIKAFAVSHFFRLMFCIYEDEDALRVYCLRDPLCPLLQTYSISGSAIDVGLAECLELINCVPTPIVKTINPNRQKRDARGERCMPSIEEFLLVGLRNGSILFIDTLNNCDILMNLQAHTGVIYHIKYRWRRKELFVVARNHTDTHTTIRIWKLPDLEFLCEIANMRKASVFSCSSQLGQFAVGGKDGIVRLFNTAADSKSVLEVVRIDENHQGEISGISFCDHLRVLVSCAQDRLVKFWDFEKRFVRSVQLNVPPTGVLFRGNNSGDVIMVQGTYLLTIPRVIWDSGDVLSSMKTSQDPWGGPIGGGGPDDDISEANAIALHRIMNPSKVARVRSAPGVGTGTGRNDPVPSVAPSHRIKFSVLETEPMATAGSDQERSINDRVRPPGGSHEAAAALKILSGGGSTMITNHATSTSAASHAATGTATAPAAAAAAAAAAAGKESSKAGTSRTFNSVEKRHSLKEQALKQHEREILNAQSATATVAATRYGMGVMGNTFGAGGNTLIDRDQSPYEYVTKALLFPSVLSNTLLRSRAASRAGISRAYADGDGHQQDSMSQLSGSIVTAPTHKQQQQSSYLQQRPPYGKSFQPSTGRRASSSATKVDSGVIDVLHPRFLIRKRVAVRPVPSETLDATLNAAEAHNEDGAAEEHHEALSVKIGDDNNNEEEEDADAIARLREEAEETLGPLLRAPAPATSRAAARRIAKIGMSPRARLTLLCSAETVSANKTIDDIVYSSIQMEVSSSFLQQKQTRRTTQLLPPPAAGAAALFNNGKFPNKEATTHMLGGSIGTNSGKTPSLAAISGIDGIDFDGDSKRGSAVGDRASVESASYSISFNAGGSNQQQRFVADGGGEDILTRDSAVGNGERMCTGDTACSVESVDPPKRARRGVSFVGMENDRASDINKAIVIASTNSTAALGGGSGTARNIPTSGGGDTPSVDNPLAGGSPIISMDTRKSRHYSQDRSQKMQQEVKEVGEGRGSASVGQSIEMRVESQDMDLGELAFSAQLGLTAHAPPLPVEFPLRGSINSSTDVTNRSSSSSNAAAVVVVDNDGAARLQSVRGSGKSATAGSHEMIHDLIVGEQQQDSLGMPFEGLVVAGATVQQSRPTNVPSDPSRPSRPSKNPRASAFAAKSPRFSSGSLRNGLRQSSAAAATASEEVLIPGGAMGDSGGSTSIISGLSLLAVNASAAVTTTAGAEAAASPSSAKSSTPRRSVAGASGNGGSTHSIFENRRSNRESSSSRNSAQQQKRAGGGGGGVAVGKLGGDSDEEEEGRDDDGGDEPGLLITSLSFNRQRSLAESTTPGSLSAQSSFKSNNNNIYHYNNLSRFNSQNSERSAETDSSSSSLRRKEEGGEAVAEGKKEDDDSSGSPAGRKFKGAAQSLDSVRGTVTAAAADSNSMIYQHSIDIDYIEPPLRDLSAESSRAQTAEDGRLVAAAAAAAATTIGGRGSGSEQGGSSSIGGHHGSTVGGVCSGGSISSAEQQHSAAAAAAAGSAQFAMLQGRRVLGLQTLEEKVGQLQDTLQRQSTVHGGAAAAANIQLRGGARKTYRN